MTRVVLSSLAIGLATVLATALLPADRAPIAPAAAAYTAVKKCSGGKCRSYAVWKPNSAKEPKGFSGDSKPASRGLRRR
jgi:hypothetical protein